MFQKIYIILLLTTLSIRPAFFVGNVVYYETHINEIIEKYCVNKDKPELQCNGQCHLSEEINGASTSNNPEAVINVSAAFFPVYFQEIYQTNISSIFIDKITTCYNYEFTYSYLISKKIHKPPMV